MRQPRIIVSVTNDLYTDQRVDKLCCFLVSQGYNVLLVGRKRKNSLPLPNRVYQTKRMRLFFDKGALFYAEYNIRLFLFLLGKKSTMLVANDLDTLLANYLAKCCKRRTTLVYDSHEYFTEVPELAGRFAKKVWEKIEGFIFPKLKHIYTVNDSIAQLYESKYGKKLAVVRNISPLWNETDLKSKVELGLPEDKTIIIIQGAGINIDRGAEEAVLAMQQVDNACLIIVGDGDVVAQLKLMVVELNLSEKVLFFGKQPYARMMNYTFHASIGLTLDKDSNLNYKYSLPNKLFDYIHTNTAVVCTDLVEITRVVKSYEVGIILDEFTVDNLASALNKLISNPLELNQYISNCERAKLELNWQKETEVLASIYPKVGK